MDKEHYTGVFLENLKEHLQNICSCMMILDREPQNKNSMQEICFSVHLIKGMAETMGFFRICRLTEDMEEIFLKAADGRIQIGGRLFDLLKEGTDVLSAYAENIEETSLEGTYDCRILRQELQQEAKHSGVMMLPEKRIRKEWFTPKEDAADFNEAEEEVKRELIPVEAEDLKALGRPIGELVMVKNRLEMFCDSREFTSKNREFSEQIEYFRQALTKLQETAAKVRFIPLGELTSSFRRKIRILAAREHKRIDLYMNGLDIGIDRIRAEMVRDILLNLLCATAEYGMDRMEVRRRQGKSSKGSIYLNAWQENDFAVIQIHDDGNGTDISCREAGDCETDLDRIRLAVEKAGGEFFFSFIPAKGSKYRIKIPYPRETAEVFVAKVHGEIYALDMKYVQRVEDILQTDILDEEGNPIPLIYVDERLDIRSKEEENENALAVIVKKGSRCAGLAVDAVMGCQEAVIRPLGEFVRRDPLIGGAVILKDGSPALTLDVDVWI